MHTHYAALFVLMLAPTLAQAQVNDNCSGAIDIALIDANDCNLSFPIIDLTSSTISTNPPFCDQAGSPIKDLWYRFYSGNNTGVLIFLSNDFGSHLGFGVYTSCGSASVACLTGVLGDVIIPVNQNTVYYLQIYTLMNGNFADDAYFCLSYLNPPPAGPANDACSGAINLTPAVPCITTTGNALWATESTVDSPCSAGEEREVWFSFSAPAEPVTITVDGAGNSTTGFDPVMHFGTYDGCAGVMSTLSCADDTGPGGAESIIAGSLIEGQMYYIRVWDGDASVPVPSDFTICVQRESGNGIAEPDVDAWRIIGNGAAGGYRLIPPDDAHGTAELRVLDMVGRELGRDRFPATGEFTMKLEPQPASLYIIEVEHAGARSVHRICQH